MIALQWNVTEIMHKIEIKKLQIWGTLILSQCSTKAHSLVDKQVINGT